MPTARLRMNRRVLSCTLLGVAGLSFCGHVLIFRQSSEAATLTAVWIAVIVALAGASRPVLEGRKTRIAPRLPRSRYHPLRRFLEPLRHALTREGLDRFLMLAFAATTLGTWAYFAGLLLALKPPIAAAAATTSWSALSFGTLFVLRSVRRWYTAASEQESFD